LGEQLRTNTRLTYLNISDLGFKKDTTGVVGLTAGLMLNKTLRELDFGSKFCISKSGCAALAAALTWNFSILEINFKTTEILLHRLKSNRVCCWLENLGSYDLPYQKLLVIPPPELTQILNVLCSVHYMFPEDIERLKCSNFPVDLCRVLLVEFYWNDLHRSKENSNTFTKKLEGVSGAQRKSKNDELDKAQKEYDAKVLDDLIAQLQQPTYLRDAARFRVRKKLFQQKWR